jgi:hypothetical protein
MADFDFSTDPKTWGKRQRNAYQEAISEAYEDAASKVKAEKLCVNENGSVSGPKDMGCACRHCTGARAVQVKEKELTTPPLRS